MGTIQSLTGERGGGWGWGWGCNCLFPFCEKVPNYSPILMKADFQEVCNF